MSIKKILVLAHPDDEILWFNCGIGYDKIYFVFIESLERPELGRCRLEVLKRHLRNRDIETFNLVESGYWKDKTKEKEYRDCYDELIKHLKKIVDKDIEFWTHNAWGEYGHDDHILVHQAVMEIADKYDLPVYCFNGINAIDLPPEKEIIKDIDIVMFKDFQKVYKNHKVWTYNHTYVPNIKQKYYKAR